MTSTLGGWGKIRRDVIGRGTSSLVMGGRYQTSQTMAQLVIIFITYASIPFCATNSRVNRGTKGAMGSKS
jgi:hypothetical protein